MDEMPSWVPGAACWILCLLALTGCKPPEQASAKAIVGAVLLDGTGGPPISDSVVIVRGMRVSAVGPRDSLVVPAEAEKIDGAGKFLAPGLIDVGTRARSEKDLDAYLDRGVTTLRSLDASAAAFAVRQAERQGSLVTARLLIAGPANTPREVAALAAQQADGILIRAHDPTLLDECRKDHIPAVAEISSLADARFMLDNGAAGFLGMIRDTPAIDAPLIARLRDLQVIFAPQLAAIQAPAELALAQANTKRLADGGVALAVASGGDTAREMALLAAAGLSPAEVLVSASRHGASTLGHLDELGTIEPGKRADLLLLSANPADDVRNLAKIERVMLDGQWVRPR